MGRNLTPTSILAGKGAFIGKPSRLRPNEPVDDRPIGIAPTAFTKEQKKVWKELVKQACPGVLKESDRLLLSLIHI